jgi:hypothetical protein
MTKAKKSRRRLAHDLGRHLRVRIGLVATREQPLVAEPALSAADRKWNHDTIPNFQIFDFGPQFDHFTHILMTEDIAALHRRLVTVKQMKVGTADRAGSDLDDRVARMLNFRVRNRVYPDVTFSVPAECAHDQSPEDRMHNDRSMRAIATGPAAICS